jgi:hypothetical protein
VKKLRDEMKELREEISRKISANIANSIEETEQGALESKRRRVELMNIVIRYVVCLVKQLFLRIYIYSEEV